MKRFVFLLSVVISYFGIAMAQNANRRGVFIEAGAGGLMGSTVRTQVLITDNIVQDKFASGPAVEIDLGGYLPINRHWAYEVKGGCQTAISNPLPALVARILPVGFRYTSTELWENYSVYAHINLGLVISKTNGLGNWWPQSIYSDGGMSLDKAQKKGYGVGYSIGFGINLSTHAYIEACWNAQSLVNCYGKNGKGLLNNGMLGVTFGYKIVLL